MPKQSPQPILVISFFSTGLYTRRSQLFAPLKPVGINVIPYHDALLSGANMEITDLMELQRRPGYSRFCTQAVANDEIVNQFYSSRNNAGTVLPFFDSNQRLALFSEDTITTVKTKSTTAQGFTSQVGNMTYYTDGPDAIKYDSLLGTTSTWGITAPTSIPTVTGTSQKPGFWLPNTAYVFSSSLLDFNGNIENIISPVSGTGTSGTNQPKWASIFTSSLADGPDLKWQNLGGIGSWLALTPYPLNSVILDPNGYLQEVTAQNGSPGTQTPAQTAQCYEYDTESHTTAVLHLNYAGNPVFVVGQQVTLSNFQEGHGFNGQTVTITMTGTSPASITFNWDDPGDTSGGFAADSGIVSAVQPALIPGATGLTAPDWNISIGGSTTDGNITWKNIGVGNQLATAGYSWRYAFRTIYGHLSTSSPATTNTGPILGPRVAQITAFQITSNNVTFTSADHQFAIGQKFYISGMQVGTYLNNVTYTVSTASATTFTAPFTHANLGLTSDSGSATPVVATIGGFGTDNAQCNYTASLTGAQQVGNIITFFGANHLVPGLAVTVSGFTNASLLKYNGWQFIVETADNPSDTFGVPTQFTVEATPNMPFYTSNLSLVSNAGTVTFNAIEIYRVDDGGGVYLFASAVTNGGSTVAWSFDDAIPDEQLDLESQAPIAHLNDPPPGQPGSTVSQGGTILAYWQGRNWMAVGNRVFFDGGPDIINGVSFECWPPANVFSYPGPVTGLAPTNEGMLVFINGQTDIILGGPQTLTFYSQDLLKNFGISSPNCLTQDGDTMWVITTQAQLWRLDMGNKTEDGTYVADLIQDTFPPTTSYVTMHRNGLDSGLFLGDGDENILRMGTNIRAWSTMAHPVGGIKALKSIETSPGNYTLMAARPYGSSGGTGSPPDPVVGSYLLGRDLSTWQDDGVDYALCQVVIGSMSLSQPGAPMQVVQHVVGYFDAVGSGKNSYGQEGGPTAPIMEIMPNEISNTVGVGFLLLPEIVQEPPTAQTQPSVSLQQLRWPVNMVNSNLVSQWMHHLQLRITFPPENAPNTIKSLSLKNDQE